MPSARKLVVSVLCCSIMFAPAATAGQGGASRMQDVELTDNGVVVTRVVDLQGNPVAGSRVSILYGEKEVASAVSDNDGLVAVHGLRPGAHVIATELGATPCRFWQQGTAPPSAVRVPAVVSDVEIVRAQFGGFNLPMVVYGTAAFVALGLSIQANDEADDANSAVRRLEARVQALETAS